MGLMQEAVETYQVQEKRYAGVVEEGRATLAPVSHILTAAQIEITLDQNGKFISGILLDKSEPKIVIPVTEDSAGRTSSPCAHPLCDQLGYLAPYDAGKHSLYLNQLLDWERSPHSHPILKPVLKYVQGGKILEDLAGRGLIHLTESGKPENEKMLVRWKVVFPDHTVDSWRDKELFESFIAYYDDRKKAEETGICMISGEELPIAKQHPKGIISINGNAKLISANDTSGFTFRGRFENDAQALTVSYEMSQKAHNALRWLAADQGVRAVFGGRTFLCWNPHGIKVHHITLNILIPSEENAVSTEASDYRINLKETLSGMRSKLSDTEKVVIAAFDAATTGRLALTYYNELQGSDYLDRILDWDSKCCWKMGKRGYQSPRLIQIVHDAFGVQRTEKGQPQMKADDRVVRQQMQRLISCRIDTQEIPRDIVQALVDRASFPQAYEDTVWRKIVFTTCAVLNKKYADRRDKNREGENTMVWTLEDPDRSFQFGRLLAAMERVEQDYYYQTGGDGEENKARMTTAIKSLSRFRQRPFTTYARIREHLWQAYFPRLRQPFRTRYEKLEGEIMKILAGKEKEELDRPLEDIYLLGYDLQRSDFFTSARRTEENGNESGPSAD